MSARVKAILQALFITFLWATSWVFIKKGLTDLPPLLFAGLRYFLAFIFLLVVLLFTKTRKEVISISGAMWKRLIVLGLLFYAITQGASFIALSNLPATTTNVFWSFSSVAVVVLGIFFLKEKPTAFQWGGILISLAGICLYFLPLASLDGQMVGVTACIVGLLANATASILGRGINRDRLHSPFVITCISMGVGAVVLLSVGLLTEQLPLMDLKHWVVIIWLALVNTAFAFTIWNHSLRVLTAMESSIINNTMQVWIPILAVLFLKESLTARQVAGMALVLMGIVLVQLKSLPKKQGKNGK